MRERLLLVVGALALTAALVMAYTHEVLGNSSEFAERAAVAFEQPEVRDELTTAIVEEMTRTAPELIAIQPILVSIVEGILATETAASLFEVATEDLHRTLFTDDDDTVILVVSDLILVAKAQITALDPELGALIPDDLTDSIIEVRERASAINIAQFLEAFDLWMLVLLAVAVAAFVAALWRSGDAGTGLVGVGIGLLMTATLMLIATVFGRLLFVDSPSPAAGAVWEAFVQPFDSWILAVAAFGAVLTAVAWFGLDEAALRERRVQLAQFVRKREERKDRVIWGVVAIIAGSLAVANAAALLRLVAVTGGVFVVIAGLREVTLALFPSLSEGVSDRHRESSEDGDDLPDPGRLGRAAASTLIVGAAAIGAFVFVNSGSDDDAEATTSGCNGSDDLCDRRLDEVTLAATHNSNAAAAAGFINGYQTFDIDQQLKDGIRGLLIDVYFGFEDADIVVTDRAPLSDEERELLVADVGESAVRAAEATRASFSAAGIPKEMFLCHALCEIGASRFTDELTIIREFLTANPREVLVVIVQDEGPRPADIERAFQESGLIDLVHVQDINEPFPTLGEMVEANQRVFVSAENVSGEFDWYHDAFTFVQDTSFSYESIDDFECALNRGEPDSPLLLVNHWLSPVSPTRSEEANQAEVLEARFDQCVEEREQIPNLIAVDFYDRGDIIEFVAELG